VTQPCIWAKIRTQQIVDVTQEYRRLLKFELQYSVAEDGRWAVFLTLWDLGLESVQYVPDSYSV